MAKSKKSVPPSPTIPESGSPDRLNSWELGAALVEPGDYFLSATNPLATADQKELHARAVRVMDTPEMKNIRDKVAFRWKAAVRNDPNPEAWTMFDAFIEEYLFSYAQRVANSDSNYPKVGLAYTPPHEWFGSKVPGSRIAGDNVDNIYRVITIDGSARFEVLGRRFGRGSASVSISLVGDFATSKTLASLDGRDLQVSRDGSYTITVDPEPANGRVNHLQSKPGAKYLFIRDSRADWRQAPDALQVHRLDPLTAAPLTDRELAKRAAEAAFDDVPLVFWWFRLGQGTAINSLHQPIDPGTAAGGLPSQILSQGTARITDDEALVATGNPAGADYSSLRVYDPWFRSINPGSTTSGFTNEQAMPNADGTCTFVISIKDPGVFNWLDTGGLHEVLMIQRWQGLPQTETTSGLPTITTRLVKFADLERELPSGMQRVTASERKQQQADRLALYMLRWVDH